MIVYVVLGLLVALALITCAATSPSTQKGGDRADARRRRYIQQNPTHVNSGDILMALMRDGVPREQARLVTERAAEHGIKPFTMWLWMQQHGARALTVVVAADLTHRDLLTHISNGTMPDLGELQLFASLNGLDTEATTSKRAAAKAPKPAAAGRAPLPPIFEPGNWSNTVSASTRLASERPAEREAGQGSDGLAA